MVLIAGLVVCGCSDETEREVQRSRAVDEEPPVELSEAGPFAAAAGVLYYREARQLHAIAALPGGGAAPDTLGPCPALPGLGQSGFRRLVVSPDSDHVAWQSAGPGTCVGVASGAPRSVRILGRWSAALPDSLIWAPRGGYLAISLVHPDGRHGLSVFDTRVGTPLMMPWETECEDQAACDVSRVKWLGGTLLNVEIRRGPAELAVAYEVNVSTAVPVTQSEES